MASILITGSSRGFGLAMVKQLAAMPASAVAKVYATSRGDSAALQELSSSSSGRVVAVKLDVSDQASIKQAAAAVEAQSEGKGLDVLINNAGIFQFTQGGVEHMENLTDSFTTNVLSVHWVTRAFLPLLRKGSAKKVVNISTTIGSIAKARTFSYMPAPAYKISKAALNALTVQYAIDYEKEGFTVLAVSPGWMKTDLGGGDAADLTAEQGARATLDIVFKATQQQHNGQFCNIQVAGWEKAAGPNQYDGSLQPW